MTLGVVLLIAAMGLAYHNDQNLADRTLASKVNLPDPVRIQDFDPTANRNLLGELQVLAEVDTTQTVLRQFDGGDRQERYLMLPIYPVSRGAEAHSRLVISPGLPIRHRPVPRDIALVAPQPVAILIYDRTDDATSRPRDAEGLGLAPLGRGFHGDLVLISGSTFSGPFLADGTTKRQIEATAQEAFDLTDSDAVPLIAPNASLRVMSQTADMTEERNLLASLATIAFLFGLSLLARVFAKRPTALKVSGARKPNQLGSQPSSEFFDPLMPQDEIQKSDKDERVSSDLSFGGLSRRVGPALTRLKSRQ